MVQFLIPIGTLSVELGGEDDIRNLQEFRSELLKKTKNGWQTHWYT